MKQLFSVLVFCCIAVSVYGQSRDGIALDEAIPQAALHIQDGLDKGSTVIVYQFRSPNTRLSDYVLSELFNLLVNSRKFIVLDRSAQEVINAEIDFQFNESAGMISDDSLASLTKRIGAEAIITGSLDDAASEFRFRVKVIGTETTAAIVSYAVSVSKNDRRVTAFDDRPKYVGPGQKLGYGAANMVLGLGSYLNGDIAGGITLSAGYAVAAGLIVTEALALDWDSPLVGVPGTIGIGLAGVTLVYGFIRPFIYNRSPQVTAILDNTDLRVVPAADSSGGNRNSGVQLLYSIKF